MRSSAQETSSGPLQKNPLISIISSVDPYLKLHLHRPTPPIYTIQKKKKTSTNIRLRSSVSFSTHTHAPAPPVSAGLRSGEITPNSLNTSRPGSAMSSSTTASGVVYRRSMPHSAGSQQRKPRPVSIAVTGVSAGPKEGLF